MEVIVHTSKRPDLTTGTLAALADARAGHTIVCPAREWNAYAKAFRQAVVVAAPDPLADKGLPWVQQWIATEMPMRGDKFVMMDDDLLFFAREPGTKRRHRCNGRDIRAMLSHLSALLDKAAHAGIMVNKDMGLQPVEPAVADCGPMRSVLAYRRSVLTGPLGARFDLLPSKADYHVALSLYEAGMPAAISRLYGHEQCGGPDLPGGSTEYRDQAVHAAASKALAALHPSTVTVVEKVRKGWSYPRMDVRVQWRKALTKGQQS